MERTYLLSSASESELASAIRRALGVGPDDEITVMLPVFDRPEGAPTPAKPPISHREWDALRTLTVAQLKEMGCGSWDGRLMLFPHEWFHKIPNGLVVEDISGELIVWDRFSADDDKRFGCLAYGIPAIDGVAKNHDA